MKLAHQALAKQRSQEAFDLFQQALALNPAQVEALHWSGLILHSAGNYSAATSFYERAIRTDPHYIDSYILLSKVYEAQDRSQHALELLELATRVAPGNPEPHAEFASMLLRFNTAHRVPEYLASILPQFPKSLELHQIYCIALKINDRHEEADIAYGELIRNFTPNAAFRVQYECYLPRLYFSAEQIDAIRTKLMQSLRQFVLKSHSFSVAHLPSNSIFQLAFHNRDNKEILQLYTKMLRQCDRELNYTAAHCKATAVRANSRIRIGFISRHMHAHSVGSCYRGVMIYLAQQPEFDVTFFNIANVLDDKIQQIIDANVPIVSLPKNIVAAQQVVASHQLDLIIYPDIGMDAMTHYLAMARLARYQCCFHGHPETTGIDTIDYFISSRSYEPPHGNENYTEQLLCTDGIATTFTRQVAPERWMTREELGLPTDKKLYVCPMAIQKFHPDYDQLLAAILQRDPNAVLVLFCDFQLQKATEQLRDRILTCCDATRVIFLEWKPLDVLFSIMHTADALMDTIYFGGGTTVQYAFGFGLPFVTMPGQYARGRVVHSYYKVMDIQDAPEAHSPEDYVSLAVKLANDASYRTALQQQLLAKNHLLFETQPYGPIVVQLVKDIMAQQLTSYRL